MNYSKHVKKQQRKQLKAQQKRAGSRASSAYAVKPKSSGKFLAGIILLAAYIANSGEVHAIAASIF